MPTRSKAPAGSRLGPHYREAPASLCGMFSKHGQHILTERLIREIFDNPEFVRRNVIEAFACILLRNNATPRDRFRGWQRVRLRLFPLILESSCSESLAEGQL